MSDLVSLLANQGVTRLRTYQAGRQTRAVCPKCEGGNQREHSLSVKIGEDGRSAAYHCHRGTCGLTGNVFVKDETYASGRRYTPRTPQNTGAQQGPPPQERDHHSIPAPDPAPAKPDALYAFFKKRGIGADTVDDFGCYVARHFIGEIGKPGTEGHHPAGEHPCIVFPYVWQGVLRNRKYRPPWKHPQAQDKNSLPTLFNVDAIAEPENPVVWVEGEPDVMACWEAGYRQVVSLKDGAPAPLKRNPDETEAALAQRQEDALNKADDHRFAALGTHADLLGTLKKIVIATDADPPGRLLAEALARRLGRHRVWMVTWPEGIKDANDALVTLGRDGLIAAIDSAAPYPMQGLYTLRPGQLAENRRKPPPGTMSTGTGATDDILAFPAESVGRLIVITGIPSHGKSSILTYFAIHTIKEHGRRWAVYSPEMEPWPEYAALCAQILTGKSYRAHKRDAQEGVGVMSDAELDGAERYLRDRLVILSHDSEDTSPTLEWLLDMARAAITRHGITDLAIDPWTEIDASGDRGDNGADTLRRHLQRLTAFGRRHGCNVWVCAHPTKLIPAKPGAKIPIPTAYDINGGAQWFNKASVILSIYRDGDITEVHTQKIRFQPRLGRQNAVAKLRMIRSNGRFTSADNVVKSGPEDI